MGTQLNIIATHPPQPFQFINIAYENAQHSIQRCIVSVMSRHLNIYPRPWLHDNPSGRGVCMCSCLKHRSKIIEPGTYGMNPNAIATMKAFIEETGKKTYKNVEDTGRATLKNINVMTMTSGDNVTGSKQCNAARMSSKGPAPTGGTSGDDSNSKRGFFSQMVCCPPSHCQSSHCYSSNVMIAESNGVIRALQCEVLRLTGGINSIQASQQALHTPAPEPVPAPAPTA